MAWIAVGTLAVALIAVLGAVWAAVSSWQRYLLGKEAGGSPLPIVVAYPAAVVGHPGWTRITVEMKNRTVVPIELLSISFVEPANGKMLIEDHVREKAGHNWEPRSLLETFPAGLALRRVAATAYLNRIGSTSQYEPGNFAYVTVYAHLPLSRFEKEPQPRLRLEMRWEGQTTKTFAISVNVIKPIAA